MITKTNDQAVFDKPRAAVAAFQRLCPQLTSYARIVTGNVKLRVQPGKASMTDGTTIWVRPPLSLAKPQRHQYDLCNAYYTDGRSMCPACASREEMMTAVHHEIAHCAFGSFLPLSDFQVSALYEKVHKYMPVSVGQNMLRSWANNGWAYDTDHTLIQVVGSLQDKYLSSLYFFTEDMRVNEKSFLARPGLRQQMMAFERALLDNGIENDDDTFTLWSSQPIDAQICVGVYLSANGHDLVGSLDSTVVEVLSNKQIKKLIRAVVNAADVFDTFYRTAMLISALRDMGHLLYVSPEDEEDDDEGNDDQDDDTPGNEGEGDNTGGSAGDDETSEPGGDTPPESGDGGNQDDSSGQEGDDSEGNSGSESSSTQSPPDVATEAELERILSEVIGHAGEIEACSGAEGSKSDVLSGESVEQQEENLTKVINTAWILDHIPRNIAGINVNPKGQGEAFSGGYYGNAQIRPALVPDQALIGKAIMQARIAFGNNARVEHHRNQRTGKVQSNVLGKRAHLGDDRLFGKKIVPDKRSYHVLIGFDVSYSTASGAIDLIKDAVRALADVCSAVNVEFSIYAHSSEESGSGYGEQSMSVGIYKIKEPTDRWDTKAKELLDQVSPVSGNLDGHTLQYYRKELDKSRATDKVLMYFTDGKMPASNYDEELAVLKDEIELCKRKQYTLLGVGIGTSSPADYGLDTVRVDGPEDYQAVVKQLTKRMVK